MNILHIKSNCFQEIPPKNWGAIEKIIWNYKIEAELKGYSFSISTINDVTNWESYDIVHCHLFDDALKLRDMGVNYFFSFHDHHATIYGENSELYKNNLKAIEKSLVSFVHADYLIKKFNHIPQYLKHGVDSRLYCPGVNPPEFDILCVGNNGYCGEDIVSDRKGFKKAFEIAKNLNKTITIIGPTNSNKKFFEQNNEYFSNYKNLNIYYDLNEVDLINQYQKHNYLLHLSEIEAGNPPLTVLEAMSCGLKVFSSNCGKIDYLYNDFESDFISNSLDSINQTEQKKQRIFINDNYRWEKVFEILESYYKDYLNKNLKYSLNKLYKTALLAPKPEIKLNYSIDFLNSAGFEILNKDFKGKVSFIDNETGLEEYSSEFEGPQWLRCAKKYFVNWKIKISNRNGTIIDYDLNLKNKNVLIKFESSSLGDNLAWIPYAEEFRKKHECNLYVFTFYNDLFKDCYPEIRFTNEEEPTNLFAKYLIGIYESNGIIDYEKHRYNPLSQPLQKTASDILGLDYKEIKPKIKLPESHQKKKQVCIATQSTTLAKYWNREQGWETIVDFLTNQGYEVIYISKEDCSLENVTNKSGDYPLEERIKDLIQSEFFIGIGSGLSWLAWACGIEVVMISGFSEKYTEFNCNRIINENVCHGCFNHHILDKGNWFWCPNNMDFICSKSITPESVIEKIRPLIKMSSSAPSD